MSNFGKLFIVWTILVLFAERSHAQGIAVTRPSSSTLFRPYSDVVEGTFTSLPFQISAYGSIGYDDNVFTSHENRQGSGFDALGLDLATHIGNARTQLDADLQAGFIDYWDRPGGSVDPDIALNLNFTYEVSPRLLVGISSSTVYQAQPSFSLGVGTVNAVGNYLYTSNVFSLAYQWTHRFSTVTSYTINALYYDDAAIGTTENRLEHVFAQQFRFLVLPAILAVAEYRFAYEQYLSTNFDSYSNFLLGGADVMLGPRLLFSVRAGAELRTELFSGGEDQTYPYLESSLGYAYQPNSYIQWYNRFGLEQSDLTIGGVKKVYRTGIRVLHSVGAKLKLTVGAFYSHNQYDQPFSFNENDLDISVGANYQITRSLALQAGYTFTRVFSEVVTQDYYRNRVFIGLNYAF